MNKITTTNSKKPAIEVKELTKSFRIPLDGSTNLKQKIINGFSNKKGYRDFTPLKNVSFTINKGDFFGIVGRNGSGKSTLLKTIAGIYSPENGHVKVHGLLVPFIELGVGFNPELTGRENVFLNGALLGFSRAEMNNMYDEIVDFAELHDFMEERLRNYSSGMQVRLAFSIAIRAQGDTLLLDEVLAVGDAAFQQKCFNYFEKLKLDNQTIVLVTHSMEMVKRFCNRALLLEEGSIKLIGIPEEVADQYTIDNIASISTNNSPKSNDKPSNTLIEMLSTEISKKEFNRQDSLEIKFNYKLKADIDIFLGISIVRDGRSVAEINSLSENLESKTNVVHFSTLSLSLSPFNPGYYTLNISIFNKKNMEMLDYRMKAHNFVIKGKDLSRGGVIYLDGEWSQ